MASADVTACATLVDEVKTWIQYEGVCGSYDHERAVAGYESGRQRFLFRKCAPADLLRAVTEDKAERPVEFLSTMLSDVDALHRLLNAFAPREFRKIAADGLQAIRAGVMAVGPLDEIARGLPAPCASPAVAAEPLEGLLRAMVWRHLEAIVQMRVTTLSCRFAPTEALFAAYRAGLLPFGLSLWDDPDDVPPLGPRLWCLFPAALMGADQGS